MIIENGILIKAGEINGVFDVPAGVTSIGNAAFRDCTSLTSVTIPDTVTSIDDWAFSGCTSLTNLIIPDSVTSIGICAFSHCTSLTNLTISGSLTSISGYAFQHCTSLTSLTIPNSVTSIGEWAFAHCTSLTSLTIPNSVTSIDYAAFWVCTSLTSLTIPNSVTSIGKGALSGCTSLTSLTIPNSVTLIDEDVFSSCASLTSLTIPNSVTSIGKGALSGCTSLTSLTIPNSVTSIGERAFSCCTSLTNLIIPDGVTSIGICTFSHCTSLTSLTIPNSVTSIDEDVFSSCTSLTHIYVVAEIPEAFNLIKNQLPKNLRAAAIDIVNDITTKLKELEELARITLNSDLSTKPTSSLEEQASVNRANELIKALSSELLIIRGAMHQNLEQRFYSEVVLLQLKKNCFHDVLDWFMKHRSNVPAEADAAFPLADELFYYLHQHNNTAKINQSFLSLFQEFHEAEKIGFLLEVSVLETLSLLAGEENNMARQLNEFGIDRCLPSSAILKILNEAKGLDNDLLKALNEAKDNLPLLTATQVLNLINSSPLKEVFEKKYQTTKIVTYESIIAMSNKKEIDELRSYRSPMNMPLDVTTLEAMLAVDPTKAGSRTYQQADDEINRYFTALIKQRLLLLTATEVFELINFSPLKEVFEKRYQTTKIVTYESIIAMSNKEEIDELRRYELPTNMTINPQTLREMLAVDPTKDGSRTYQPTDKEIKGYCNAPIKESKVSASSQGLFSASTSKKIDNYAHKPWHGPSSSSSL